jgi:uncharacterized protein
MEVSFIFQSIFLFFFFAFFGWGFELFLEFIAGRGFVNRGFFYGPIVPIYAAGFFFTHIVCQPLKSSPVLVFLVSAITCTLVEYCVGRILEKCLRLRAWDYDQHPFTFWCNYKKTISLTASITFGLFALIVNYFLWDSFLNIIRLIDTKVILALDGVFTALFLTDAFFSFKKYIAHKRLGVFSTTNGLNYEHDKDEALFFNSTSKTIVENKKFLECARFIQHGKTSVYAHSLSVAKMSFRFSAFWKVKDRASLIRAALLHDFFLYDWHSEWKLDHGFTHPLVAAENAVKYFNVSEKEYSLIRTHMWPFTPLHPPKHREGWIICFADKICSLKETLCFFDARAINKAQHSTAQHSTAQQKLYSFFSSLSSGYIPFCGKATSTLKRLCFFRRSPKQFLLFRCEA